MKLLWWKKIDRSRDLIVGVEVGWLFKKQLQFRGSSTVWRYWPNGVRAGIHTEYDLSGVYARIEWGLHDDLERRA